jgi:acetyl-CoA carboxylase biotin carboxylase subunit
MFQKILIANRGEIALRIIRACKELGIATVAVHSEADANSLHVRFADEDVCIGPGPSSQSYLNIPSIISAAELTDTDAIHPGYGFLAENAYFAEVCESCDIKFVGPSAEMIRQMGDKVFARHSMAEAGLPVIPGSHGVVGDIKIAREMANEIGYPLLLKAAAGGGGKGIRLVKQDKELQDAFQMAQAEAQSSFGNPALYIERYIEKPRHVEIQILADQFGNVVHLGERDCSIQRKHQKLVEESPSPAVDEELRQKMGAAAINGAKSIGYQSVGTVEFLLTPDKEFYFMEMNTRIQVEHPVTEMVVGIDLVKEQIRLAAGEKIRWEQKQIKLSGHAIECRINAEDPERDFAPCPGTVSGLHIPGGPEVRIDTYLYVPYRIPPFYDSLLAKVITHGETREEAINRMQRVLEEVIIEGVPTTIPLHQKIMKDPNFRKGWVDTTYIETMTEMAKQEAA